MNKENVIEIPNIGNLTEISLESFQNVNANNENKICSECENIGKLDQLSCSDCL